METALVEYLNQAPVFVRKLDGEILYWTKGAEELYGFSFDEAHGRISHELLRTVFPAPLQDIERSLKESGVWQGVLRQTRADGATIWLESRWRLRRRSNPEESLVVEANTNVTQRETLANELKHRVRNTLAVVQGLARLTFRSGGPETEEFNRRLAALADAYGLLVQHHWARAGLLQVFDRTLSSLGIQDRVDLRGEETLLEPNSVVAYSLAFHELATNALKYGSLSVPEGKIDVQWRIFDGGGESKLHLIWREIGGPPLPAEPERTGSGTYLLKQVVAADLGTPVSIRFEPSGLVCEFDGPTQKESELQNPERK